MSSPAASSPVVRTHRARAVIAQYGGHNHRMVRLLPVRQAAALVFPKVFFPGSTPYVGVLRLHGEWPQVGVPVGLLLSTGMVKLMSRVTGSSFDTWGWRVPFLASVVAVGLYVRLRVLESPALRSTRTRCHRNN